MEKESIWNYRLTLTDEEEQIKEKALKSLESFESEEVSRMTVYFTEVDDNGDYLEDLGSEYDICDNDECLQLILKDINKSYPNKIIQHVYYHNDSDHEYIERCNICSRPLNEWMTWIKYELEHYLDNKPTLEDLKNYSSIVFNLSAIFESFPSIDAQINHYHLHQKSLGNIEPFNKAIERQKDFKDSVIGLMNHIIKITK